MTIGGHNQETLAKTTHLKLGGWTYVSPAKVSPCSFAILPPTPLLFKGQTLVCFLTLKVNFHFLEFYIETYNRVVFCLTLFTQHAFWDLSMSLYVSVIQIFYCYFPLYGDTTMFIYSPINGHWGCFHFLTIENKTTVNIHVWVIVWTMLLFL